MFGAGSCFLVLLLTLQGSACPIHNPGRSFTRNGTPVKLARRSFRQRPPVQNPGAALFDPSYAQKELQDVLAKYAKAPQFLKGIGLASEPNITGYLDVKGVTTAVEGPSSLNSTIVGGSSSSGVPPVGSPVLATGETATLPLRDEISGSVDVEYYGTLKIGTSAQSLSVDIDTGSADLWIPVNCDNCPNRQFDSKSSSTYADQDIEFSISYGSGDAVGTLATDVVSVGPLTVQNQTFGAVNSESSDFQDLPNDGLLGLAFSSIASSGKPTWFENLISQGALASPLFSVHLSRGQTTGSEICFGCFDSTKTAGTTTWLPVVSKTYWTVAMDALYANPTSSVPTTVLAAIDTGTTFIFVPDAVAAEFYALIPGAEAAAQYGDGFYTFPCSSDLSVALSFGGHPFSLNQYDFNLGMTAPDSNDCVGGILSLGSGFPDNLAIVGDEFLKSWYSTYDYSNGVRVGFTPDMNNQS